MRGRILCSLALLCACAARGQQYAFIQYTPKEGLAQSQVRTMVQDRDGYLWFGTLGGASRFDGHAFHNYALPDGLPDPQVNALLLAHDGTLWLGSGGALASFDGQRMHAVPLPAQTQGARVLALAETNSGDLLVGTDGAGIYVMGQGRFEQLPGFPSDTVGPVRALLTTPDGDIIAGTRAGAYRWHQGSTAYLPLGDGRESISALVRSEDGTLWFGTFGGGLFGLGPNGEHASYDESNGLLQNNVRALMIDARGRLWVGSKFGANLLDHGKMRSYTVHQGLPNDNVWCLFQDRQGDVWLGTDGAGALRFAGDRFVAWTALDGLCSDLVMTMVADARGDLWMGTYGNGVCRLDGMANLTTRDGLPNNTIWCSLLARDSSLWFGTSEGLCHVAQGRVLPLPPAVDAIGARVLALHQAANGDLWCATNQGLLIITDGTVRPWEGGAGDHPVRSVRALLADGDAHFLATDDGLVRLAPNGTTRWTMAQGLCDNMVQCLLRDASGRIWAGTANGLACMRKGAFTNVRLAADFGSNYIDLLVADKQGYIWAGTNNGVYRFRPDSLLQDPSSAEHITAQDGLRGTECNLNAGFVDPQGRVFFGTNAGLAMHDPGRTDQQDRSPAPAAHIVGLRSFMVPTDWKGQSDGLDPRSGLPKGLDLVYRKNHLTFDYTAVDLAAGDRLLFQYRLLGFDADWLPPTDARFASYSNLPQGVYTFQVRAARSAHAWGPADSFSFRIAPPFWLRWWFFVLCGTGLVLLTYGVMRFRSLRRQRQEKTRQLMLRSRMLQLEQQALNANMNRHFIFNALNSIQFYINRQDRQAANRYLTSFAKLIRKNLDASRTDTTTLAEELERLDLYLVLENMRFKDKFKYAIHLDPAVDTRHIELPAMMLQPYVENSIWHGILPMDRPGTVTITVGPGLPDHVRITIQDDGIGVKASQERKNGGDADHISRGIEITKGRADVLRKLALADIRITGPDQLHGEDGEPSGTLVTIELPSKDGLPMAVRDLHNGGEHTTFERP